MDGNFQEWTVSDVCNKINEKYDKDVAKKFKG